MSFDPQCLIVEHDLKKNEEIQELLSSFGLKAFECGGFFNCEKCTFEPDAVILGKGAHFPASSQIGNVEVMIRETYVPVFLPAGSSADKAARFHNYHAYENLEDDAMKLKALVSRHQKRKKMRHDSTRLARAVTLMDHGEISFKNLTEAQALSSLLGTMAETYNPYIKLGLCELFINAIEHGNLELKSNEKFELRRQGRWLGEIESRLSQEKYKDRNVKVSLEKSNDHMHVSIKDDGHGFDWKSIMKGEDNKVSGNSTPLGLKLVSEIGFEELAFKGNGNEVYCSFRI